MEVELDILDDNRVSCIVPALSCSCVSVVSKMAHSLSHIPFENRIKKGDYYLASGTDVSLLSQEIHQLAFALVAPLCTQDNGRSVGTQRHFFLSLKGRQRRPLTNWVFY
jgi:hypothetical protein